MSTFHKILVAWWVILVVLIIWLFMFKPVEAQEFEFGPHGFGFNQRHHHDEWNGERRWRPGGGHWEHRRGGQCRELRAACMYKEDLGEVGQGNCRRYRENCQ